MSEDFIHAVFRSFALWSEKFSLAHGAGSCYIYYQLVG